MKTVDLRTSLLALSFVGDAVAEAVAAGDDLAARILADHWPKAPPAGCVCLRFRGAFGMEENGGLLGAEHLAQMLSICAGRPLEVVQQHRLNILTRDHDTELLS